jgi:hypothetical protein
MSQGYDNVLQELARSGWTVENLPQHVSLPVEVTQRYPGIPDEYRTLLESVALVAAPNDSAWLVTGAEFAGTADSAYSWNEWEQQSLDAAGKDDALRASVRSFWDRHMPILMSVKSGYAYFALDLQTLQVVQGEEPEYEETSLLAESLEELFHLIVRRDPKVQRWI